MAEPLATSRGTLAVPAFLPDATRAGVRGASSEDLRGVRRRGRRGQRLSSAAPSRARAWCRRQAASIGSWTGTGPILSDSGGFQVWSLIRQDPSRGVIRDNEVIFREPTTGEKWNLTPERVVKLQLQLGSDVIVCLDDPTAADDPEAEQERSVERTVRWARRCREELDRQVAERGDGARRGSSPSCRAAASRRFDASARQSWPPSASMATASAAGRSAADGSLLADALRWVADALPPRRRSTRLASVARTTSSTPSPSATRSSTARCPRGMRATAGCMPSGRAGRPAGRRRAMTSTARSASTTRATGSTTSRSRRAATARSARAIRRPTCTTCSRSATRSAERLATLHNLRFYVRLFELLRQP